MTYRSPPPTSPPAVAMNRPGVLKFGSNVTPHIASLRPHPKYYFPDGSLTFLVQSTIFRVHRYFFERESEVVRDILKKHPYSGGQDDTVIPLTECTCEDFESLLWVFYNERYDDYTASKDTWKAILFLSAQLKMPNILSLVKRSVPRLLDDPVEQVQLQVKYDIEPEWAIGGYVKLVQRHNPFSLDEAKRLGLECMVIIQKAKFISSSPCRDGQMSMEAVVRDCIQEVYGTGPVEEDIQPMSEAMVTAGSKIGTPNSAPALLETLIDIGPEAPSRVGCVGGVPTKPSTLVPQARQTPPAQQVPPLAGESAAIPRSMPPRPPPSPLPQVTPRLTSAPAPQPEIPLEPSLTTSKKKKKGHKVAAGSAAASVVPTPDAPSPVPSTLAPKIWNSPRNSIIVPSTNEEAPRTPYQVSRTPCVTASVGSAAPESRRLKSSSTAPLFAEEPAQTPPQLSKPLSPASSVAGSITGSQKGSSLRHVAFIRPTSDSDEEEATQTPVQGSRAPSTSRSVTESRPGSSQRNSAMIPRADEDAWTPTEVSGTPSIGSTAGARGGFSFGLWKIDEAYRSPSPDVSEELAFAWDVSDD